MKGINLLQGRAKEFRKKRLVVAKIQFVTALVLVFYIGLVIAVVAIGSVIKLQRSQVSKTIKKEELRLSQLKQREEKYVLIANKLGLLDTYLKAKGKSTEMVYQLYSELPEGVGLKSIALGDEDEGTLAITAVASNLQSINTYLKQTEAKVKAGNYKQVAMTGISRAADGTYQIKAEYLLTE